MTKNILLSGVGGQGTITAAKMLTFGLMEAGYDVKMSEIHGMSQRGGDVVSQVRYSKEKVFSPVIELSLIHILCGRAKFRWFGRIERLPLYRQLCVAVGLFLGTDSGRAQTKAGGDPCQ